MRTLLTLGAATLALAAATPAGAAMLEYQYSGLVTATAGPSTDGVMFGDTAHVRVRFDTASLVDITDYYNTHFAPPVFTHFQVASLRVPAAQLELTVGAVHFDKADEYMLLGDPIGLGGNPYAAFNNGLFAGVLFFALNASGSGFVTAGPIPATSDSFAGAFDFLGGIGGHAPAYGGTFDYAGATMREVPEPAAWALMIGGFGVAGATLRRRRSSVA
jgi:hypothetical protein